MKLLSIESVKKINELCAHFSRMTDGQRESLSGTFGVEKEKLKNLSPVDSAALILRLEKKKPALSMAVNLDIAGIDRKGEKAVVTVENGMYYCFVKEGPYWKFDIDFE